MIDNTAGKTRRGTAGFAMRSLVGIAMKEVPKNRKWPFSASRAGWLRWYKGKTRFVCSNNIPLSEVENRWIEKKRQIDLGIAQAQKAGDGMSIGQLCSLFLDRQERRMNTGRPSPLSGHTFKDYLNTLALFSITVGDKACDELTPEDFEKFARRFDGKAASSLSRAIAYIRACFRWAEEAGHCEKVRFGPDFKKPPESLIRSERIGKVKSYSSQEIHTLWCHADFVEKLWMMLGLNGALDNSDLSNLTWDLIDLETGIIDYRRRKTGKVRRVIPLAPRTLRMLRAWHRHARHRQTVFLTPEGHNLVRLRKSTKNGILNPIDFVSMRWSRLMHRAGVVAGAEHRRGFRGLRTTFANLVPPGYGDERRIVMGHAHGSTFLDDYLEKVGVERIREAVNSVVKSAFVRAC